MTIETANRLYELRKKHNLSQEELAERLGVSRQAVSKWERSEASPDTDNLIALAKIYGLTLDELIYGESNTSEANTAKEEVPNAEANTAKEEVPDAEEDNGSFFIDIEEENERVKIGPMGIVVESDDGEKVKIGFSGIHISTSKDKDDEDDGNEGIVITNDGHFQVKVDKPENKLKFWLEVPYAIICTIAYLVFGFYDICGGWALSWIIFVTIPIYYSLVEAIYSKRFSEFAYPILTAFIYLYLGLYQGNWHPSWIIFITIPVYYSIADAVDKRIRERRRERENGSV